MNSGCNLLTIFFSIFSEKYDNVRVGLKWNKAQKFWHQFYVN